MIVMSEKIIMDTDVLSSFAGIRQLELLLDLFPNQIIIPEAVLKEFSVLKYHPGLKYIYHDVKSKVDNLEIEVFEIMAKTKEKDAYVDFLNHGLGAGEAECMAIAVTNDRIISSSNLRDVGNFVHTDKENKLVKNIPTLEILKRLYIKGYSLDVIENMKKDMIKMNRKLPPESMYEILIKEKCLRTEDLIIKNP